MRAVFGLNRDLINTGCFDKVIRDGRKPCRDGVIYLGSDVGGAWFINYD